MSTTQSKNSRRFDEEFKREVAALASRPGASDEQVGRDLGVSAWSVARWRRRFGVDKSSGARTSAAGANLPSVGGANNASVAELERRIKALERENADLRLAEIDPISEPVNRFFAGCVFFPAGFAGSVPVRRVP